MDKVIIGKKVGMSQVFDETGRVVPVTVIEAGPCVVTQIKTVEQDGYSAIQVGFAEKRKSLVNKPATGTFKKAGVTPRRFLREFQVANVAAYQLGQEIRADVFVQGDVVDVTSRTKGRGTTGVIQRWNQNRVGPMSHGTGPVHRAVGSMGAHSFPSRVFPGKKMPGHYGDEQVTIQNLTVVKVDAAKNCILIKGGIPGADGALVSIRPAKKGGGR